jgi:hypothetical protein
MMGKLLWTLFAAATGFVAAVVATPDDDSVRRAYERGYADGTKSQQTDAVRRGYAVWSPSDAEGTPDAFRWSSQVTRGRGSRWTSDQKSTDEPVQSGRRERDHSGRREQEAG